MKIKRIDFNLDSKSELAYSGRTLDLLTDKGRITGPCRLITTTEYNSLQNIPINEMILPENLSIIPKEINNIEYSNYIIDGGNEKSIFQNLCSKVSLARHSNGIITPIWVSGNVSINENDFDKFHRKNCFIQKLIKSFLGKSEDLFINSVFFPDILSDKKIDELFAFYKDYDLWVPIIKMKSNTKFFKKILNKIISSNETYQIPIIIYIYSNPLTNLENYDFIWSKRNLNIMNILCNTPRESPKEFNPISSPHYLHTFCFDGIGRQVYHHAVPKKDDSEKPYRNVKYFNKKELTIIPEFIFSNNFDNDIISNFPEDNRIINIFKNRNIAKTNHDIGIIKSISNIHEYFSGQNEFNIVNKYIKNNEYIEYMHSKPLLNKTMDFINRKKDPWGDVL